MKKRKQQFILLEVMMAMTLLTLFIFPIIDIPLKTLTEEFKIYQKMQLQRISDAAFAAIQAKLYRHEISWEQLNVGRNSKSLIDEMPLTLATKGAGKKEFKQQFYIWTSSRKKGREQDEYRIATIEVRFIPIDSREFFKFKGRNKRYFSYFYKVFIHQKNQMQEEASPPNPPAAQLSLETA